MNETIPFINPWLIYFIGISENLSFILTSIFIASGVVFGIDLIVSLIASVGNNSQGEKDFCKLYWRFNIKLLPIVTVIFLVSLIGSALIPPQKWLIALAVNSQINPKNLNVGAQVTADVYKQLRTDFFSLANKVVDSNKKEENKQ